MPLLRIPHGVRREPDMSGVNTKQPTHSKWEGNLAGLPGIFAQTVVANPELFLPVFALFVWQTSAVAVKPATLAFATLLALVLLIYAYRVLGTTAWLRRLGWVAPRPNCWLLAVLAGSVSSLAIWWIARLFHESVGPISPPNIFLLATVSGPMVEELLFRGLLFWAVLELLGRGGVCRSAANIAAVLLMAVAFAFAHTDKIGIRFYATIPTGIAFGWMRVQSGSSAAAVVMHASYNFLLASISTF
jgi:membrane protease YdiL (CAAX protease family)